MADITKRVDAIVNSNPLMKDQWWRIHEEMCLMMAMINQKLAETGDHLEIYTFTLKSEDGIEIPERPRMVQ